MELKPNSDEPFIDETLSKLFSWDWVVDIGSSSIVLKVTTGEEISIEDCSLALILEISLEIAVISWIELKPILDDVNIEEIISELSVNDGIIDSKVGLPVVIFITVVKNKSEVVFRDDIIELRSMSVAKLSELFNLDWRVDNVVSLIALTFVPWDRVGNSLFGFSCESLIFWQKEGIALSLFLKEQIALFAFFIKSNESDLLSSPLYKD